MKSFLPILLALLAAPLHAAEPGLRDADRIGIAEAFRIADALGDEAWPGWSAAPFAVLLVTPEREFLMRHPAPSPDFAPLGRDDLLGCEVYARKRTFSTSLLATFPAVAGSTVPTIVIGQPERTEARTPTRWVLTLLHEHFHQLQFSRPGYFGAVEKLGLTGGDTTGMWMLNYPYPYAKARVASAFREASHRLLEALDANDTKGAAARDASVAARERLRRAAGPKHERYLAFQLWQEGTARYTELVMARLAAARRETSPAFRALDGFVPFADVAAEIEKQMREDLTTADLGDAKRVAFYAFGCGEALLLDRSAPGWRTRYLASRFRLEQPSAR